MLNLMDFQSKRIITIIHFLSNKSAQLTVSDIAKMNDCSDKTVYNDINFIQNSWNDMLNIERYNNVFIANIKSQSHVKYIYSQILANSSAIKILVAIFTKPDQSIHYYATKTNTSITNLYNSIKAINTKLEEYDIKIMNENRTFRIHSKNEDHYLMFFTLIFLETEVQKRYKCTDVIAIIKKRLKNVFIEQYESIALLEFYSAYYYVNLLNLVNNKQLTSAHKVKENRVIEKDINFYYELKTYFPTMQDHGFNYIESKVDVLCQIKNGENLEKQKEIKLFLAENLKNHSKFIDEKRLEKMVKLIKVIVNGFSVDVTKLPRFSNRYESFSARIQTRSPETYEFLNNMYHEMAKQFHFNLDHSMDFLIYWTTLTFHDIHFVRNKRILVVSDHNQIHADYLKNNIQTALRSYEYDSYYLEDYQNWKDYFNEDDYFRIISTCKLRNLSDEKIIVIGDYIALDDLATIFLHISEDNQTFKK